MIHNFCLYDGHDMDGIASAYVVWTMYKEQMVYIPVTYGEDIPEEVKNRNIGVIYILDFRYPIETLRKLQERAHYVFLIDHHKSTEEELKSWDVLHGAGEKIIVQGNAACVLTWRYLYPETDPPLLLQYIEDRDLWKWKLERSREVSAALSAKEPTFETIQKYIVGNIHGINDLIIEGGVVLTYQNKIVKDLVAHAVINDDDGGNRCAVINSCIFQSELGELMCKTYDVDYAIIYFDSHETNKRIFSLRSSVDSGFDVSVIAVRKGGGGHFHAAGYSINL